MSAPVRAGGASANRTGPVEGVRRGHRGAAHDAIPLVWVDAFCEEPFSGNPAAVCLLERPAPEGAMQALARELGLSETAFVWPRGAAYDLRWFTPEVEVDLCGHATVAAAHALVEAGAVEGPEVVFATRSGILTAAVDGVAGVVTIDVPAEEPVSCEPPGSLGARWSVARAATGRFDLLIELADADAVRAVDAATPLLADVERRGVIVTARGGPGGADYVLRFFGPRVGVAEDPVTGSAQCLLGPYWAAALGRTELRAAQLSRRGGSLGVCVAGERVRVSGSAVTVVAGHVVGAAARRLAGSAP